MQTRTISEQTERLLPVLVHIQSHLAGDLSLAQLAQLADLSPYHFHRTFRDTIGETLKQHTQRLRLERAASQLRIRQASILDIALSNGFQTHETFTRAFKRHFAKTPQDYRQSHGISLSGIEPAGHPLNTLSFPYEVSPVTVLELKPIPVAFIRHFGPYEAVDTTLFDRLIDWAQQRSIYNGDNLLLGIGHDDPGVTPAAKLRFDACIEVPGPFVPQGNIAFHHTPPGLYASVSYVGPYGRSLQQAYMAIFQHVSRSRRYGIIGLPALEIYRTTRINPDYALNLTDIYVPIETH